MRANHCLVHILRSGGRHDTNHLFGTGGVSGNKRGPDITGLRGKRQIDPPAKTTFDHRQGLLHPVSGWGKGEVSVGHIYEPAISCESPSTLLRTGLGADARQMLFPLTQFAFKGGTHQLIQALAAHELTA